MIAAAWVALFLPLAAAVAVAVAGQAISRRAAGWLATAAVAGSFVASLIVLAEMLSRSASERSQTSVAWSWLTAGQLNIDLSILVDPLSVLMMLVVSGVGALIVGYSIGYMDGDDEERRFFAYMAFFVFSMLLLVQGGNLLLLLAGWGLVGLSSYLLIGFWHHRPAAVAAAKKAFVMNAFGDATFALSLFLLIQKTGALDYASVFTQAARLSDTVLTLVALGLLGGAVAKSAQLPLHTWLPDAMEGPTPVSALIHAATMVTAGVYLLVRTHPLLELAPEVQDTAAALGTATVLAAGLVALVQTDIKRVIAYSTMSQIGYMFLAAGLGAYAGAMFHLMTHAFFKALMFLAAGVVIHALAGEQDMRRMGGLARLLPKTCAAFLVGSLALVGLPPFAGFFSKDPVVAAALARGGYLGDALFSAALAGVFLTGLYAFRMVFLVFSGEPSPFVRERLHHDHGEGPRVMLGPVGALALLSVAGGWLQARYGEHGWGAVSTWLQPVAEPVVEATAGQEILVSVLGAASGLAGLAVAWWIYGARRAPAPRPLPALERKLFFDEAYDALFYWPAAATARALYAAVEEPLVAGSIEGISAGVRRLGQATRALQTGLVRTYALVIAASLAVLTVVLVAVR